MLLVSGCLPPEHPALMMWAGFPLVSLDINARLCFLQIALFLVDCSGGWFPCWEHFSVTDVLGCVLMTEM